MGTDADDNFWPQGNGTSAVTANIIQHHLVMGVSHADAELYPKSSVIGKIPPEWRQIRGR